jgi:hypothetical protein
MTKEKQQVFDLFRKGRQLYLSQKFREAAQVFQAALEVDPADGPSSTYLKRCNDPDFLKVASMPGWDGAFEMTSK